MQTAEERANELRAQMEANLTKFAPLAQSIKKKELQKDLMEIDAEKLKVKVKEDSRRPSVAFKWSIKWIDGAEYIAH